MEPRKNSMVGCWDKPTIDDELVHELRLTSKTYLGHAPNVIAHKTLCDYYS